MYTLSAAATAAGAPPHVIAAQIERGIVRMRAGDVEADGYGSRRQFSRQRVLQLAILQELSSIGHRQADAARYALAFTDRGSDGREPGDLFPDAETLLVVDGDDAKVVCASPTTTLAELTTDRFGTRSTTAAIVNLRQVVERVDRRLAQLPPQIEFKGMHQ